MAFPYTNCESRNKIIIKIKSDRDTQDYQDILRLYYMPPIISLQRAGSTHLNSVCQNHGIRRIDAEDEVTGIQYIITHIHPNTLVRLFNVNTNVIIGVYLVISDDIEIQFIKARKKYYDTIYLVKKAAMDDDLETFLNGYTKPTQPIQFRHKRRRFVKKSSSKKKRSRSRSRKPRRQ